MIIVSVCGREGGREMGKGREATGKDEGWEKGRDTEGKQERE